MVDRKIVGANGVVDYLGEWGLGNISVVGWSCSDEGKLIEDDFKIERLDENRSWDRWLFSS